MKKLLSVFLVAVLLVTAMPLGAFEFKASAATSGTTGDCTWTLDGTVLTISGNGAMANDYNYSAPWGTLMTEVIIENNVTNIGDYAFHNCTSLTNLSIGDSVTNIGASAFYNCTSLTNLSIGDSVTSIGPLAFYDCIGLTSITISDSVTSIDASAFYNTGYYNNSNNWENNVLYIGNHLICAKTSISGGCLVKDGTVTIGKYAFSECYGLTSITIPNSVTSIGDVLFDNCSKLTSINVSSDNNYYSSVDGVLFNKNKTTLVRYPVGKTNTSYNIPEGVTSIGDFAFYWCFKLTNITIPNSVTSIGISALLDCKNLTNVTIPDSVTSMGNYAFENCSKLASITIPNSIISIGSSVFASTSLKIVYYRGSNEDKTKISISSNNSNLIDATWYYNSCIGTAEHQYGDDKVCDECGRKNFVLGDIDGTGVVDLNDVNNIARYFAGWNVEVNKSALDVNGDGLVNLNDLVHLAQYVAGWEGIVLY